MSDIEIHYPNGYPFVLMEVVVPGKGKHFITDLDPYYVRDRSRYPEDVNINPVYLETLISAHGHNGTNKFLKRFGKEWCAKRGLIFFKERV